MVLSPPVLGFPYVRREFYYVGVKTHVTPTAVWKSNEYTRNLTVRVIDRDGGAIGAAVSSGLVSALGRRAPVSSRSALASLHNDTLNATDHAPCFGRLIRDLIAIPTLTGGQLAQTDLGYFRTSPTEFPTDAELSDNIVDEGAWAAIVIQSGATDALDLARSHGNSSYDGSSAVLVYYSQARQETAVGNYLLPFMQSALGMICGQLSTKSAAS